MIGGIVALAVPTMVAGDAFAVRGTQVYGTSGSEQTSLAAYRHQRPAATPTPAPALTPPPAATPTPALALRPTLKLVEVVSGGTAGSGAWTLNAGTNTDSFSGPGPAIGPSSIAAGVAYSMFETGGPASGYTPGGWICTDPTGAPVSLAGQRVTLQAGQNATCTITNTYLAGATPTPAPVATPTPAPVVAGIAVPATIDATGSTDASAALISFVGTVPDGSTIVFKAGGVYRMDSALKFAHRHNLT
ncbi:MAG TPA: hypothetical protein VIK13_01870, partial [Candidatus Limnocylindrales bacterium]